MIIKKLSHVSKKSVKITSDDGVYYDKKFMFISHLVMKIFAFEVCGGYKKPPCTDPCHKNELAILLYKLATLRLQKYRQELKISS